MKRTHDLRPPRILQTHAARSYLLVVLLSSGLLGALLQLGLILFCLLSTCADVRFRPAAAMS